MKKTTESLLKRGCDYLEKMNYADAFKLFSRAAKSPENVEAKFWLAAIYFIFGHVAFCREILDQVTSVRDVWEENDPKEALLQKILSKYELEDFSTIYLDAWEFTTEQNENPMNRWVYLANPTIKILQAKSESKQSVLALDYTRYLGYEKIFSENRNKGKELLGKIIKDFRSDVNGYRFGDYLLDKLGNGDFGEIAKTVLALQLEHLKEFGKYFGLTDTEIAQSEFNTMLTKLPYRLGIAMNFLFHFAQALNGKASGQSVKIKDDLLALLVNISFASFYQEVDYYSQLQNNMNFKKLIKGTSHG